MNHTSLLSGLALTALLLPFATGTTFSTVDDEMGEAKAKLASLVASVLEDAENDVVYECTCSEEGSQRSKSSKGRKGEQCSTLDAPKAKLTSMIVKYPDSLTMLQPIAVDVMRSKKTTDKQSEAFIGLLLDTRSSTVLPVVEAMHKAAPERFCSDSLLGFCEMGSRSLTKPLAAQVKKGKAGVPAAAFLALDGDKVGRRVLKKAYSAKDITTENALDVLMAGYALEELGRAGAFFAAQVKVHDAAIAALDSDDLATARALAITAKVANSATRTSKPLFSLMPMQCSESIEKAETHGKLSSADQIFELIQKATPIG